MVPAGCGLTEIVGEYKVERETPGEILYKPIGTDKSGD
jgi:acetolactate synthase-1/2/3 large subunit